MVQNVPQPSEMFPKHRLRCLQVFSTLHTNISFDAKKVSQLKVNNGVSIDLLILIWYSEIIKKGKTMYIHTSIHSFYKNLSFVGSLKGSEAIYWHTLTFSMNIYHITTIYKNGKPCLHYLSSRSMKLWTWIKLNQVDMKHP